MPIPSYLNFLVSGRALMTLLPFVVWPSAVRLLHNYRKSDEVAQDWTSFLMLLILIVVAVWTLSLVPAFRYFLLFMKIHIVDLE